MENERPLICEYQHEIIRSMFEELEVSYAENIEIDELGEYDFCVNSNLLIKLVGIDRSIDYTKCRCPVNKSIQDTIMHAADKGYRIIHIYEWDNLAIFLSKFKATKQVRGQVVVDQLTEVEFNMMKHICNETNYTSKGSYKYGLYWNDDLVAAMVFQKSNYRKYEYQLNSYLIDPEYDICGHGVKLLKRFCKDAGTSCIAAFQDLAKEPCEKYIDIGMVPVRFNPPRQWWYNGSEVIDVDVFRETPMYLKAKARLGPRNVGSELFVKAGFVPAYDCGRRMYEYRR